MWRTSLRSNYVGIFAHLSPNPNRRSIHVEESYLLAAFSAETVDADGPQEAYVARLLQVLLHTQSRRISEILNILDTLRNDVISRGCRSVLLCEAPQQVIRCVKPVRYQNAHCVPRIENQ